MRKDAAAAIEHDLWFNPHLGPNFATDDSRARSHAVISVPLLAVKEHDRKRRLRSKAVNAFFRVMIPVLSNLIVHYLRGSPGNGVPVPLSNQQLGKKGDRYDPLSFPRSFPQMLKALRTLGFAEVTLGKYSGFPGQSKRTTMRAGPKIVALIEEHKVTLEDFSGHYDEEVIVLSRRRRGYWDEGQRIDYEDKATTRCYRQELRAINEWLGQADIRSTPLRLISRSTSRSASCVANSHSASSTVAAGSSGGSGSTYRKLRACKASASRVRR